MNQQDRLVAKARQKVIEAVAMKMVEDALSEDSDGIELPRSWYEESKSIFDMILHGIAEEAAVERGDYNAKAERDARRQQKF